MANRVSRGVAAKAQPGARAPVKPMTVAPCKMVLAVRKMKKAPLQLQRDVVAPVPERPAQLVARFFDSTGKVLGRRVADDFVQYVSRRQIPIHIQHTAMIWRFW